LANFNYAVGTIRWAKVLGDPVPNYNRDGFEWTFDLVPNAEALALFRELGIDNKMKEKDGVHFMRFTQKQQQANGRANFPITVVDARNRPWDPKIVDGKVTNPIGNDSLVEVKFKKVAYGVGKPVGVYPQAIRVLEFKPYVRQEFAPLPEDSEYVQNFADDFAEPVEVEQVEAVEDDPLEG
jgi:hypothetical protein